MDQYSVEGMSCAACQARVEKAVSKVQGVTSCSVSLLTNSMGVEGTADPSEVIRAVEAAGYGASRRGGGGKAKSASTTLAEEEAALIDRETPKLRRRLIASIGFLIVLMYITMGAHMLHLPLPGFLAHNHLALTLVQMLLALTVMLINSKFFTSGFSSLLHGAPNMDTLVALGSFVSFAWSTAVFFRMTGMITAGMTNADLMEIYHRELYYESAAMIPALITVGKMLEAMSKGRTTDALKSLMKLAPKTAFVIRDGVEAEVPIDEVSEGDVFAVRPGGSIPVDGIVLEGESAIDESALTGESIPVDKVAGDKVSAATINRSGYIRCRATRVGEDTTLSQIIRMVSDAAATKAPIARIADKVSGIFVPTVIGIAAVVIIGWLLAGQSISFALARGISVLVISCPCALGLATPVAIMVGNGIGAKNGILFKTSEALERAGKTEIVALDKTGTITKGEPAVTDLLPAEGRTEEELLIKAAALEARSEHPLARAVSEAAVSRSLSLPECGDFEALPGNGLKGTVGGKRLQGGSGTYIGGIVKVPDDIRASADRLSAKGKTPLFFEEEGALLGVIAVADIIREDSAEAVALMRRQGLRVVMLTGDNEKTAAAIGQAAGVDRVISGVLPDGKEAVIRALQESGKVAMVGDGINDAPSLTRADVGIAIGAGTDVAIDSADVVLVNSTLMDVSAAVRLSRATLRNIHENLFWAFFYNLICIPLAAGLFRWKMNPMIGAAAMSLSSFTVCMNALRLNLFKIRDASRDRAGRGMPVDLPENLSGQEKPGAASAQSANSAKTEAGQPARAEKGTADEGTEAGQTITVRIGGMMCGHCEMAVKTALEKLDFVESAKASHEAGTAVVRLCGPFDEAAVRAAVESEDYEYLSAG